MHLSLRLSLFLGFLSLSSSLCHADTVRLKIIGPDGKPVGGATVHAVETTGAGFDADVINTDEVETGEAGLTILETKKPLSAPKIKPSPPTASLPGLVAPPAKPVVISSLSVMVTAPGFRAAFLNPKAGNRTLTLQPGRTLSGVVLEEDQKPVENIKIEVKEIAPADGSSSFAIPSQHNLETTTDNEGHWQLDGLPQSGNVEVQVAQGDSHLRRETLWLSIPTTGEGPPLFVEKGATVKGRLLKPDGTPAKGVRIMGGDLENSPTTATSGIFQITHANTEQMLHVFDKLPFLLPTKFISNLQSGEVRDIGDWQGTTAIHIRGKVVDAVTKKPLEGASISSRSLESNGDSDESGDFDLTGSPATSTVSVSASGYIDKSNVFLPAPKGGVVNAGTIALRPGYTFSGTLRDRAGQPVGAAGISLVAAGGTEDDDSIDYDFSDETDGTFKFEGLEAGRYSIVVDDRKLTAPVTFTVGPKLAALKLNLVVENLPPDPPQTISGRVFNGKDPIAGAKILLDFAADSPDSPSTRTLVTNLDGTFSIALPLHGATPEITLASRPGFASTRGEFKRENGVWRAEVALAKSSDTLRGRVVDGAGQPVAGAFVGLEKSVALPVATNGNGEFALQGVLLSGVTLLASDGPRLASLPIEKEGQTLQIVLPDAPLIADKAALADEILNATPFDWNWTDKENWDVLGPQRIQSLLQRQNGEKASAQWRRFLRTLAEREPQTLLQREAELTGLVPADTRDELTRWVMLARASSPDAGGKATVRDYLTLQEKQTLPISHQSLTRALYLTEIASRLDAASGEKWLGYAAALAAQFPDITDDDHTRGEQLSQWGGLAARISPDAAETLAQGWHLAPHLQLLLGAITYYGEHGDAINARTTLSLMQDLSLKANQSDAKFKGFGLLNSPADFVNLGRLQLARALAPGNPAAALNAISQMDDGTLVMVGDLDRSTVLLDIARFALKLGQQNIARQALKFAPGGRFSRDESSARAAEIALQFDAPLAQTLFPQAYNAAVLRDNLRQSIASYAGARAQKWPGESRILLEREWAMRQAQPKDKDDDGAFDWSDYQTPDLIVAMALLSPRRALEMVAQLPPASHSRSRAASEVALALLRTPAA